MEAMNQVHVLTIPHLGKTLRWWLGRPQTCPACSNPSPRQESNRGCTAYSQFTDWAILAHNLRC